MSESLARCKIRQAVEIVGGKLTRLDWEPLKGIDWSDKSMDYGGWDGEYDLPDDRSGMIFGYSWQEAVDFVLDSGVRPSDS